MRIICLMPILLISMAFGCKKEMPPVIAEPEVEVVLINVERASPELTPAEKAIFETNVSEELVLALTPRLDTLAKHLRGESVDLSSAFSNSVEYQGIGKFELSQLNSQPHTQSGLAAHASWPLEKTPETVSDPIRVLWSPLLELAKFEDTQFGIVEARILDESDVLEMQTIFEGRFRDDENRVYGVKASQTLGWLIQDNDWRLGSWTQTKFEIAFSPKLLFENVTDNTFDNDTLAQLKTSRHEELILERAANPPLLQMMSPIVQYFSDWNSLFQYPSVSIVDLDNDKFDDLYVTDRWGESMLMRNQGDGTFRNVTESAGLELGESLANCALFADFDNDGDSDVLIGRSLTGSSYFRNDNGKFVLDDTVNQELRFVRFVSAGSVVDINNDGLLDVYLSTYCTRSGEDMNWIEYAVPPNQRMKLAAKIATGHPFLDRAGPPNVVLMNNGGKLTRVPVDETLEQWRVSFQSVWTDIDGDGDQDMYLCNDFAPDVFLRNDTARGSFLPEFTDITDTVFPEGSMGFGMGASFGDYNSDGMLDLYVSNMYSKAGKRVIKKIGGLVDPKVAISAQGNFLYKNTDGKFEQVAGEVDGQQQVSKVGWSFGGQFADFNNDGRLDLYVPSGFFTAPKSIAAEVDL